MSPLKSIYFVVLICASCQLALAQSTWKKAAAKDFIQSLNQARNYMSDTKQFAFNVNKIMSRADGDKKILSSTKMLFKRNGMLMMVKSNDLVILQNNKILLSLDSANKVLSLDKAITMNTKSLLGNDIDAYINSGYKEIQKMETVSSTKYKLKFVDEADTTILHSMEIEFDKKSGFMQRSLISFGAPATFELKGGKTITAKLRTETIFSAVVEAKPLSELDLGFSNYVYFDAKDKAILQKKYVKYQLIDQRNLRE
jgi:hypothetical protein